jgi:hypothetical protein
VNIFLKDVIKHVKKDQAYARLQVRSLKPNSLGSSRLRFFVSASRFECVCLSPPPVFARGELPPVRPPVAADLSHGPLVPIPKPTLISMSHRARCK